MNAQATMAEVHVIIFVSIRMEDMNASVVQDSHVIGTHVQVLNRMHVHTWYIYTAISIKAG